MSRSDGDGRVPKKRLSRSGFKRIDPVLRGGIEVGAHSFKRRYPYAIRDLQVPLFSVGETKPYADHDAFLEYANDSMVLPRSWALDFFERTRSEVYVETVEAPDDAFAEIPPIALRPEQEPVVEEIIGSCESHYDFLVKAPTASGKTVMMLEVARRLQRRTLVVVDQNFLADQWSERIQEFMGLSPDAIGIIQGTRCDYDKLITIGMMQTLYQMQVPEEMATAFGLVVYDECHITGAEQFSRVLFDFHAVNRVGVSATPRRKDSLQKIIDLHFGKHKVELKKQHKTSQIRFVKSTGVYSWYANISPKAGRFISEIADDSQRNALLCSAILYYYERERDILVISDRIAQLENLAAQCVFMGMDSEDVGLVTGKRSTWKILKDATPTERLEDLFDVAGEYTPICLQRYEQRNPRPRLERLKEEKRVLFTTYSIFSKGVDVPRLSVGVDCTPRASAIQVHGRILRSVENKKRPVWVTVRDVNSFRAEHLFASRIREYMDSNAEIYEWNFKLGVKRHEGKSLVAAARSRCARLKECRVVKQVDGLLVLEQ